VDALSVKDVVLDVQDELEPIEVIDYRDQLHPLPILESLRDEVQIQIWSEADAKDKIAGRDRNELQPGENLVIWTTPPGPNELQRVLASVCPKKVYLFAVNPGLDQPVEFLKRLAGLVKFVLQAKEGQVMITSLAAATAQRESVVEMGLAWLEAQGHIRIVNRDGDRLHISEDRLDAMGVAGEIALLLKGMLGEIAAYRAFFQRAEADALINVVDEKK
jgi:hypothetical protein